MTKSIQRKMLTLGVGLFAATVMVSGDAHAGNNFSTIAQNIVTSIQDLPGLLSGLAYMFGILLAVLGVMKIKDHVENPGQTPLKDGAIRLAAGGGLFAIPMVSNAMINTIGTDTALQVGDLTAIGLNVQ